MRSCDSTFQSIWNLKAKHLFIDSKCVGSEGSDEGQCCERQKILILRHNKFDAIIKTPTLSICYRQNIPTSTLKFHENRRPSFKQVSARDAWDCHSRSSDILHSSLWLFFLRSLLRSTFFLSLSPSLSFSMELLPFKWFIGFIILKKYM